MLDIKVETENRQNHTRVSEQALSDLVHRIGGEDDHFLVVQRIPDIPGTYVQVWHEHGGDYQLEHRSGGPATHCRTMIGSPERVAELMARWAREEPEWDAGMAWESAGMPEEEPVPELPAEIREQLEERVRVLLRCGYGTVDELAEAAEEYLVEDGVSPVTGAQAQRLVERLWLERVEEQRGWSDLTDADRLERAFAALDERGITAREHFSCCRACGLGEIYDAGHEDARGFVFFHLQCTESAAAGQGLSLYYGGFDESEETTTAVGREVAAALEGAGLTVKWDGSPDRAIELFPLDWRKRLVG
ncbi:helix-hairpin-helix domain-containing protein [Streptomyces sp. NPDC032161]|uniref:helix-hairpin-helix domain-containing protein n=1 Tax=unclassified Streptomyces TaxID=2593676 RepID=UPI0033DBE7C6